MIGGALAKAFRVEYEFTARPVASPAHLRSIWRLASICLILRNCWGNSATLKQLHVLNWAVRDTDSREAFLAALGNAAPSAPIVRVEPSLNRAVDFAIGERLITRSSIRLALAARGADLARRLEAEEDVFLAEKAFFAQIGKKVTTTMVDRVLLWNALQ